jgi:hypothetical protein
VSTFTEPVEAFLLQVTHLLQNMNGNLRAAQAHMQGLQHMVNLRGGLEYLGLGGRLANLLLV